MNILITNDDGYFSEGLEILANKLAEDKKNKVFVVAPMNNRSAVGTHISFFNDLALKNIKENVWASEGYPVDCAAIGIQSSIAGQKIDVVVSGINCGANLGTDIVYSGTCSAARHAVIAGTPAIAVSVYSKDNDYYYEAMADFVAKNLKTLFSLSATKGKRTFVNVNGQSLKAYKGVQCTDILCQRYYNDTININNDNTENTSTSWKFGEGQTVAPKDSDFEICEKGYIAVSVVNAECVAYNVVDAIDFNL